MALVTVPFEKVAEGLGERRDIVAAIMSSPSTCVVSGTTEAIEEYAKCLKDEGAKLWKAQTDIGFHSPMLESLVTSLQECLGQDFHPQLAVVPIYSTSASDARTTSL